MKVAIYARVSTDDKGQTVENQLITCTSYCERKGYEYTEPYLDEQSGKDMNRPGFQRLISDIDSLDGVIVTAADRYSRTLIEALISIEDLLKKGKLVIFANSGKSLDTYPLAEDDWLSISIQFMLAEYYRRHLSTQVKASVVRMKKDIESKGFYETKKGKKITSLGRPEIKFTDEQLEKIASMYNDNYSINDIARETKINRGTVYNLIKKMTS